MQRDNMNKHLIFYDGACGLCDHFVFFVLKRDKKALFDFASLQGETAKITLAQSPDLLNNLDTVVFIESYQEPSAKIYTESEAVFRILGMLGGFWNVVSWLGILPSSFFNYGYRWIARNRKHFFSSDSCQLPTEAEKGRFLP